MSSLIDAGDARWFRFLSRWCLLAGLVVLALFLVFGIVVLPASQNSPLPGQYDELVVAIRNPALFRITSTLDVSTWLVEGGFLITLAALLGRRAPMRSTFIAACGIGQLAGVLGAFTHLDGVSDLATRYVAAAPEQQAGLLRSYLDLQLIVSTHFNAGALLWALASLLVASVIWSLADFPRWLTGLIALQGAMQLTNGVFHIVTGANLDTIFLVASVLEIGGYFALAWRFWRRTPTLAPGLSGATAS